MNTLLRIFFGALLLVQPLFAAEEPLLLVVNISGAESKKGQILATVFDAKKTHMKTPAAERVGTVDQHGNSRIEFRLPELGDYSVSVIYDADSDGELDTGLFGIPKEKIGFSNNARGNMGPASWSKSRFEVIENPTEITISLADAK